MRRSLGPWSIFNVFRQGKVPTPKELELNEDLRPYFKDMRDVARNQRAKFVPTETFAESQLRQFPLFEAQSWLTVGRGLKAQRRSFSDDELKLHPFHLFIMYQIGFYASNMANDWKRHIVQRWPTAYAQLYSVEIADSSLPYRLLRATTAGIVRRAWCSDLAEGETVEQRLRRQLFVQESSRNRSQVRKLRRDSGVLENKYVPFVYAVNRRGQTVYRACGLPEPADLDVLATVIQQLQ